MNNRKFSIYLFSTMIIILVSLSGLFFANHRDNYIDFELKSLLPDEINNDKVSSPFIEKIHNQIIVAISIDPHGSNNTILTNSLQEFMNDVKNNKLIEFTSTHDQNELLKFYFNHRYLVSIPDELKCSNCDEPAMENKIKDFVQNALFSPFSAVTTSELEYDPFLAARSMFSNFGSDLKSDGKLLYIEHNSKKTYLFNLTIATKLNNTEVERLASFFADFRDRFTKKGISFTYTGGIFFANSAQKNSVEDLTRITVFSIIFLIILYVITFRNIKPLLLTVFPMCLSFLYGFFTVELLFGSIHILAITLGATLIGICVDYYIHSLFFISGRTRETQSSFLLKPLFIALITSLIAYAVIGFTNLIVLKELAVFAICALITTFIFIYILINASDYLNINKISTPIFISSAVRWCSKTNFKSFAAVSLLLIAGGCFTLCRLVPDDDVASMQKKDLILQTMDREIQQILHNTTDLGWYIINGESLDKSLRLCEQLISLTDSRNSFFPCRYLPSLNRQHENMNFYRKWLPKLVETYAEYGIKIDTGKTRITDDYIPISEANIPMNLDLFINNNSLLLKIAKDEPGASEVISSYGDIIKLDTRQDWSEAFKSYRQQLDLIFGITLLLATIFLGFYFGRQIILKFVLPILTGLSCALMAQYFLGNAYFNLFTTLALYMLLGLGSDYCIFFHDTTEESALPKLHTLIITLLTTEASFGILGLSKTPVIESFGITLSFGLPAVFLTSIIIELGRFKVFHRNDLSK